MKHNNFSHTFARLAPFLMSGAVLTAFLVFGTADVFAQAPGVAGPLSCKFAIQSLEDIFLFPLCFINRFLMPIVIAIEVIIFIWGIIRFARNADDAKNSIAKAGILWSLVAIFVTLTFLGIIQFFSRSIGLEQQGGAIEVPQFDVS